jgi:hypothetical protein
MLGPNHQKGSTETAEKIESGNTRLLFIVYDYLNIMLFNSPVELSP